MLFFTLMMTSMAEVAMLRDTAHEVDAMGRIGKTVPEPEVVQGPSQPATRKEPAAIEKSVARSHSEWTASAVLSQAFLDPFALGMLLLIFAYVALHQLVPNKTREAAQAKPAFAKPQWSKPQFSKPPGLPEPDAQSQSSRRSSNSGKGRGPDRFALVVNQKLTRLESVDEVLDFALQSAETGRTDIVNCVTAIHRSAKLMQNKPQVERIRVGQDPRLRRLLDQLLAFIEQQEATPQILARAVGNTSWALAKLQFRSDPKEPHMILEKLQTVFVEYAPHFRPEELMNTVWAFAELRRDKEGNFETRSVAIAEAACKCIDKFPQFTLQQVVYFSWALARLSSINSIKHDNSEVRSGLLAFTGKIVERARPEVLRLDTKNLAMLSWAVASLYANLGLTGGEAECDVLMTEIAALIEEKGLYGFLPGEIASILWAVNKVRVAVPQLYEMVHVHILKKGLRGYSSQDISTITCAFVKTKSGSDKLYVLLSEAAQKQGKDFNRSEKMMMHWAFTQLPHLTPPKL